MRERGVSFKAALNDAIREGAKERPAPVPFMTRTADLGVPAVNLDRALQIAAELEDEELLRRQRRGARRSSTPMCFCTRSIRPANITDQVSVG